MTFAVGAGIHLAELSTLPSSIIAEARKIYHDISEQQVMDALACSTATLQTIPA